MGGRKGQYGYHEYRGRGGGRVRTVLLFIIALLAVLLVAGIAFVAFMEQYLEYTGDGVIVHWPWAQESETMPPIASDPVEIVTGPADVTVEPTLETDPTPTPVPEPEYHPIGAVTVTAAQLRDGSAAQAVASAGGTALVVEMKDMYGNLAWQSQSATADIVGVNGTDSRTAQAVRNLAETTDLYLVARVQGFRDPALARNWIGSIMTRGGNVWYDTQGLGWSSPANWQAADYLCALCAELADMGFDEILLDSPGYPDSGEVKVLATSDNRPEDLTVPVGAFWQRLADILEGKGAVLSIQASEDALRGDNTLSGVTAANLAQYAGRVWLTAPAKGTDYAALLTAAGMEDTTGRIVVKDASSGSWYR